MLPKPLLTSLRGDVIVRWIVVVTDRKMDPKVVRHGSTMVSLHHLRLLQRPTPGTSGPDENGSREAIRLDIPLDLIEVIRGRPLKMTNKSRQCIHSIVRVVVLRVLLRRDMPNGLLVGQPTNRLVVLVQTDV